MILSINKQVKYDIHNDKRLMHDLTKTPQCDETRFLTIQPSIDITGIRNERWQ